MSKRWPDGTPVKRIVKTVGGTRTAFFYPTGDVWRGEYHNRAGELHRAGTPAIVAWHPNNQVWLHKYYHRDNLHHESGPAIVGCDGQDNLEHLEYYTRGFPVAPPPQ